MVILFTCPLTQNLSIKTRPKTLLKSSLSNHNSGDSPGYLIAFIPSGLLRLSEKVRAQSGRTPNSSSTSDVGKKAGSYDLKLGRRFIA